MRDVTAFAQAFGPLCIAVLAFFTGLIKYVKERGKKPEAPADSIPTTQLRKERDAALKKLDVTERKLSQRERSLERAHIKIDQLTDELEFCLGKTGGAE